MACILMLCHDQHLDRRVVAQAVTLILQQHSVRLLALSFDKQTTHELTAEGIQLTRIGLDHIVPENPTYKGYMKRQYKLNTFLNWRVNRRAFVHKISQRLFTYASHLNWNLYKALLLLRYQNRMLHDPLPFRQAFVKHGLEFPSDLVQVHDLPALEAGAELAAKWNVPLAYDAHELYPEQKTFSRAQRKICSESEARHIKKANVVFAVNDSIAQEMAQRYQIDTPVTLLNAIDPPPEFKPEVRYDLLREKLNISAKRRILLFQGGFSPYRNLENLIAAISLVKTKDIDLVMMGFGSFGELLKKKSLSLGLLGSRIYFLEAVPQSELLQHSASADIGIIPYPHVDLNSYYCTPNKLFEFIQAGLPILANDSPELNRFVRKKDFGMTRKMNTPHQIAEAIDIAFSAIALKTWKKNLEENRVTLTWQTQKKIYSETLEKHMSPNTDHAVRPTTPAANF
ncbi:glycosyltransferase [Pseudomonas protegens]|uniref:glycosyltransferase n=1 Tax=Pseudomonas protegens TaxID=380021 RepID=UPI000CD10091|nr:glycosyltransferase [Pseudomonas protegens]POA91417.1 hypothetical protein C1883_04170 [Pseudomonas protegens]PZP03191.1 MAG: hypothetical protein DI621_27780 [Pseudomonas protegens]BCQ59337.1 hypothetical protein PBOI14_10870 [Pseudomonas sp. Boi14]